MDHPELWGHFFAARNPVDRARLYHNRCRERVRTFPAPSRSLSDVAGFRPESREEFIIVDTENGGEFISGTRKLRVSGLRLHISSPTLVETSMSRLSYLISLRPFARSSPDPDPRPSTSRRPSVVPSSPLSPSTHAPRTTKTRPPPLVIRSPMSAGENHVTVVQSLGRAPTLVLRLSPMALPCCGAIAAMSEHIQSVPVSAVLPPSRADAAPLTEPLPRIHLWPPPENHVSLSGNDKGRRSSDVIMPHRRPIESAVDSGALQSREPSRSMPSSPRAPDTLIPAFALTPPTVPRRTPAPENGISSDDSPREAYVNIKIVGSGQPHVTRNPARDLSVRTSIVLERLSDIVDPEASPPTPELGGGLARMDSGVLSKDELVRMRRRAKSVY
jgi:hypothetical protein